MTKPTPPEFTLFFATKFPCLQLCFSSARHEARAKYRTRELRGMKTSKPVMFSFKKNRSVTPMNERGEEQNFHV
jgi:hypothetical protein